MQPFYPDIEPFSQQLIETKQTLSNCQRHQIYVEQCGNREGIPVVFLHGGPGSGCRPQHRCYFDPELFHIILFDQRGCGRSLPTGELENNDSQHLIEDMELIRTQLNIDSWVLFGGSWGATLALLYAQTHPDNVLSMVLRGTFLGRQQDIDWVYAEGGASKLFPEAWQQLVGVLDQQDQQRPLKRYFELLTSKDKQIVADAAWRLNAWEGTIVTLRDCEYELPKTDDLGPIAHSLIQLQFALSECFISNNHILDNIEKIRHIPTQIIHGRYDIVCPVTQSWQLHKAWPESQLTVVPLAGHAAGEPAIVDALITATKNIAKQLS
jgi:proline iminopeptidase